MPEVGETRVVWLDDSEKIGMTFCWIPPGEFRMGSRDGYPDEQPFHWVVIENGFWLGRKPVTRRQFAHCFQDHKNHSAHTYAAEAMAWNHARGFCNWLTTKMREQKILNLYADLPTESQWEYACRASTDSDYYTGDGEQALMRAGWYGGNCLYGSVQEVLQEGTSKEEMHSKQSNVFGLFDTHGSVYEWCRDAWIKEGYRHRAENCLNPFTDPKEIVANDGGLRVARGGSWGNEFGACRSAARVGIPPGSGVMPGGRWLFQGLRVGLFSMPTCRSERSDADCAPKERGHTCAAKLGPSEPSTRGLAVLENQGASMTEQAENRIALSSTDGQAWTDINGKKVDATQVKGEVTRVVIGEFGEDEAIEHGSKLLEQALKHHGQTITHLHLWNLKNLESRERLPPRLQCLDLRGCTALTSIPELPESLKTLDLEGCKSLEDLPQTKTPNLQYLHLDGCTSLPDDIIKSKIRSSPALRELTLSRLPQLTGRLDALDGPKNGRKDLRKLVLKDCTELQALPDLGAFELLNHLNLNGCAKLKGLPELPILPDPDPPRKYDEPVKGLRYLVTHGCKNLREYRNLDLREVHLSRHDDDNIIDTIRTFRFLGDQPAELVSSKLLILGSGRVGKTTLAKALQWAYLHPKEREKEENQELDPFVFSESTSNVKLWPWQTTMNAPLGQQKEAAVHIWDFAGQDIYHNTHRLFAASGSLFVIVCCEKEEHERRIAEDLQRIRSSLHELHIKQNQYHEVRYWLDYIRSALRISEQNISDMPVILVHTGQSVDTRYIEEQAGDPYSDFIKKQRIFRFRLDYKNRSFHSAADLDDFKSGLSRRLYSMADDLGIRVPQYFKSMHQYVEELLRSGKPKHKDAALGFDDWQSRALSIMEESYPQLDSSLNMPAVRAATRYMHATGWLFWLEKSGGDVLIDQQVGAAAIYLMCGSQTAQTIAERWGIIGKRWLRDELDRYPEIHRIGIERFIRLLQKCGHFVEVAPKSQNGQKGLQAIHPELLLKLDDLIVQDQEWFTFLAQPEIDKGLYVNCTFSVRGAGNFVLGESDFQGVLAWLVRASDAGTLPILLTEQGVTGESITGRSFGNRWFAEANLWRNGIQVVMKPRSEGWEEQPIVNLGSTERASNAGLILRLQFRTFKNEGYEGGFAAELLTPRALAHGVKSSFLSILTGSGGPLSFLEGQFTLGDEYPSKKQIQAADHRLRRVPRDPAMWPWQDIRNPTDEVKRHRVAISSRGCDKDIAIALHEALLGEGIKSYTYHDDGNSRLGPNPSESDILRIYEFLDNAQVLVLICSSSYLNLSDTYLHEGNIFCPVELAAAAYSLRRSDNPRNQSQIVILARESDGFKCGDFDHVVNNTLTGFRDNVILKRPTPPPSTLRQWEYDRIVLGCSDIRQFLDLCGAGSKQVVIWDGTKSSRAAAIAEVLKKVKNPNPGD